jgi:hypothetical protein
MIPGLEDDTGISKVTVERASVLRGDKRRPVAVDVAVDTSGL